MKLNDIPKHNIYQVPDGYFDRLPMRVMEHTAAKGTSAAPAVFGSLWKPVRLALAPLVLLLIFVGVFFSQLNMQQDQPAFTSLATIPNEDIVAYLDGYAPLQASDFEELDLSNKELTAEFTNISSEAAEAELDYYNNLNSLIY